MLGSPNVLDSKGQSMQFSVIVVNAYNCIIICYDYAVNILGSFGTEDCHGLD